MMDLLLWIVTMASCVWSVMPLEERLLVGYNTLQGEIQELRSKVTNLENDVAVLKSMINTSMLKRVVIFISSYR